MYQCLSNSSMISHTILTISLITATKVREFQHLAKLAKTIPYNPSKETHDSGNHLFSIQRAKWGCVHRPK